MFLTMIRKNKHDFFSTYAIVLSLIKRNILETTSVSNRCKGGKIPNDVSSLENETITLSIETN